MKVFNSDKELRKAYGERMARTIKMRLAVLKNARTLTIVPTTKPDRRHQLKGNRSGQYAVDLDKQNRIVFVPNHDPIPRKSDGGFNTDEITAIEIVDVGDYH